MKRTKTDSQTLTPMAAARLTRRAACASALAGTGALVSQAAAQQPPAARAPAGGRAAAPRVVASPETAPDGRITFRLAAPNASEASLAGEWPGGARIPMIKDGEGVWSVTVGPLPSEMWCYSFQVDGVKTLDPSNMLLRRDVLQVNNLVFAPGAAASLYSVNAVPHGTVAAVWYPSPSLKKTRRMHVYTPPGYESGSGRYPVLYLLHGAGGDEAEWLNSGRTAQILDNLIAQGQARPMIVVMPNGHAGQEAAPDVVPVANPIQVSQGASRAAEMMDFPDSLVADVVPFIEKHYRVLADREHRAVAGLSMGGAQAAYIGLRNLDKFAWVASFSGAFVIWQYGRSRGAQGSARVPEDAGPVFERLFSRLDAGANQRLRLLYFSCGLDDFLLDINRRFKDWLKAQGLRFVDVETPGYAHVWSYWRKSLAETAPRLFQPQGK